MSDITIINSGLLIKTHSIPVGPLTIVASLERAGYDVDFKDYQGRQIERRVSPETFKNFCETDSNIIGISVICNSLPTVMMAIKMLKEEHPDKTIILGGAGATDVGTLLLEYFPIDFIVLGEGENTIVNLMNVLTKGGSLKDVKGIAYKENGKIIKTLPQERITDLNSVPLPAYHHINYEDYDRMAPILTARGCPFNCAFCSCHSIFSNKVVYRDIESIIEEIKILAPHSRLIGFMDDTFIFNKEYAFEIVDAMQAEGIDLPWCCNGKISLMDDELLEGLQKRNCHMVFYGVESGSDRILEKINKGHTSEQARKIIHKTTKYVKFVRTSYIWGYPFATMEDFFLTVDSLHADMQYENVISQLSQLSPLPNAPVYKQYGDQIAFDVNAQPRAGGLPINENLPDYPEVVEAIKEHPEIFTSFYHFKHDTFYEKLKFIKKIDWKYSQEERKRRGW